MRWHHHYWGKGKARQYGQNYIHLLQTHWTMKFTYALLQHKAQIYIQVYLFPLHIPPSPLHSHIMYVQDFWFMLFSSKTLHSVIQFVELFKCAVAFYVKLSFTTITWFVFWCSLLCYLPCMDCFLINFQTMSGVTIILLFQTVLPVIMHTRLCMWLCDRTLTASIDQCLVLYLSMLSTTLAVQ